MRQRKTQYYAMRRLQGCNTGRSEVVTWEGAQLALAIYESVALRAAGPKKRFAIGGFPALC